MEMPWCHFALPEGFQLDHIGAPLDGQLVLRLPGAAKSRITVYRLAELNEAFYRI